MTTPSVVLNSGGKKKKWIIPKIVATFVCASSQGQRTHSARTKSWKTVPILYPIGIGLANGVSHVKAKEDAYLSLI
jgi:hypothetical protein